MLTPWIMMGGPRYIGRQMEDISMFLEHFSRVEQIQTPGTHITGCRCIRRQESDVWMLSTSFLSTTQMSKPGTKMDGLRYILHHIKGSMKFLGPS
jgi:hypothetical protein